MKKTKIIVPALGLLLLGTAASVTGTVAWFSINSTVTVSGMRVQTKVGNNLQIAADNTNNSSDAVYGNGLNQPVSALLEPVSTVDGNSFFYTSSENVDGSGDAKTDAYTAYNSADTSGFNSNYGTTGAVGYADYKFYLKATNGESAARYLALTRCNLVYEGAALGENDLSWRVAVFAVATAKETSKTDAETIGDGAANLITILRRSGAQYYTTDSAVSATNAVSAVNAKIDDHANIVSINPAQTVYYKVLVRLWLEGEDKKCTNDTFASLTGKYDLDLAFNVQNSEGVENIGSAANAVITKSTTTATVTLTGTTTGNIENGETAASFAWKNAADDSALSGTTYQYTNAANTAVKVYCEVTTTRGSVYRTNIVELDAAA